MGFTQRPPTSGGVSPIASPNLPIADSSQAHDVPTGVAPSLAKLQDWTAWFAANAVLYDDPVGSPGLIGNDISIDGDLYVDLNIEAGQSVIVGNFLQFDGPGVTTGADPGADTYDSGNIPKVVGRIVTDGVGGYTVASSGKNLGLATLGATYLDIDFIRPFANAEYTAVTSNISGTSDYAVVDYANSTTTKIRLQMYDSAGATRDPSASVCRWSLIVMGRQ